jgi:LmbE family N-acetylglucosaminyl deacetylase
MVNEMTKALFLAALPLLAAAPLAAAPARPLPALFAGARSLLWIAAHPDDEALAAPLLGRVCIGERARCTFLVLTHGELGHCALPQGCGPDLGARRADEMRRAAKLFDADLVLWNLGDGGGATSPLPRWETQAGGRQALLERLRQAIGAARPDVVLTFDARHGTTCHPDHRATGELAQQALSALPDPPALFLLESVLVERDGLPRSFAPAASARAGVVGFDANDPLPGTKADWWGFLLADLDVHRSQFSAGTRRALRRFPANGRVVFIAPAAAALPADLEARCE